MLIFSTWVSDITKGVVSILFNFISKVLPVCVSALQQVKEKWHSLPRVGHVRINPGAWLRAKGTRLYKFNLRTNQMAKSTA
jgi:hypothetical protein